MFVRAFFVAKNRATAAFCHRRPSSSSSSSSDGRRSPPPWWSIPTLRDKIASMIASALPRGGLPSAEKLLQSTSSSPSIDEAIVMARAREAHLRSRTSTSSTDDDMGSDRKCASPYHTADETRRMEDEIERRALEKARERMELELRAMEEKYKSREEERMRGEAKERERREVEHMREVAFARWKEEAAREMRLQEIQEEEEGKWGGRRRRRQSRPGEDDSESTSSEDHGGRDGHRHRHHHPILGPQIARLPYKRVHLTPASTLASIPVYERQRAYRHDRATAMAKDKRKTLWMGIPGVISLMEDDDGRLSILDGQHRVGMMALLSEERRKARERGCDDGVGDELDSLDLENVLVEVFVSRRSRDDCHATALADGDDDDDMATIFTEINKAEPVKLIDLPGVAKKRTRDIIDHAASHFQDMYPAMFSTSSRCRAPHLNLDNLRDALFASEIIQREKIGSGIELVSWMSRKNDELRERYGSVAGVGVSSTEKNDDGDSGTATMGNDIKISINESALKKARKFDFFLGLESTWLYKK
ncbi:hypothetical protein ACHAXA_008640 [Cyclostephanos tholiformis]|uniref:ParB/Sulfiredoxin domain-containing protein n=1 Tax=Cyclostephanos tholiformis TaxID=382380 RepID=A0ABD3RBF6_9STRA